MQKTALMTKDIIRSNRVRVEGVFISRKTEQIVRSTKPSEQRKERSSLVPCSNKSRDLQQQQR